MERTIVLPVVVALSLGCQAVDRNVQLESNKALVMRAHVEVWSNGDMVAADEIYGEDFVGHWTGRSDTHGREDFKAFVTEARSSFPDWNETIEQVVAEGDLVVTRFTSRGTFAGEAAEGTEITMPEIAIHRISGGRIVEQWTVADVLGMRQQLGILDAHNADSVSRE